MSRNAIGIAVIGLVLVAALALPASAAQADGSGPGKAGKIDPNLKNELWGIYSDHRLQVYDIRFDGANDVVSTLERYGCPTGDLQATVTAIGNERTALSDALKNQDRKALKDVNQELAKLWKQFRQQARASIRSCSAQSPTVNPEGTAAATE